MTSAPPAVADLRRWQALLVGLLGMYFCSSALIGAMNMVLIISLPPVQAWMHGVREVRLMQLDAAAVSAGSRLVVGLALLLGAWIAARRLRRGSVRVAD